MSLPQRLPKARSPAFPKLDAALLRWWEWLSRAANLTGSGAIEVREGPSGPVVAYRGPLTRRVKVTAAGTDSGSYSVAEAYETAGGGWTLVPSGWTGTAWEFNLNASVPVPSYVEIEWFGPAAEWRFQLGGCPA